MRRAILIIAALGMSFLPAIAQETIPKDEIQEEHMSAADWKGLSVYGSDGQEVGEVSDVRMGSDGKLQALMVKTGQELGIGERTVEIKIDKSKPGNFQKIGNRVNLQMTADEVKQLPDASKRPASGQSQ